MQHLQYFFFVLLYSFLDHNKSHNFFKNYHQHKEKVKPKINSMGGDPGRNCP